MSRILVVDDVALMRDQYAYDLKRLGGHDVVTANGGKEALEILGREAVDCVILDLEMPGMDGFDVLRRMTKKGHTVPVIVYTGTGDYDRCVEAVKLGAVSFIDKSESMQKVAQEIENALERRRLESEVETLRTRLGEDRLVGESRAMETLRGWIERLAPIPSPVLILGESGSGKDLVAREIHRRSGRKGTFLALNCAAIPENLVESELFGHEAGAFTGAEGTRKGAFENAHTGTLFLDEIGELPLPMQSKLLRVIEDGQVTRVGGSKATKVDTRVLAATNRNLEDEVEKTRFRQDLLFRINVHQIVVPPLRERPSDITLLVEYFLPEICRKLGMKPKTASPEVLETLSSWSWERNNVRELRNIVERMIIATEGDEIGVDALPPAPAGRSAAGGSPGGTFKEQRADAEREIVLAALDRNDWHITNTAKELGLADHSSLLRIMKRHKLKR
jgi:two-component system nitrogen regulation response regulator NtrX